METDQDREREDEIVHRILTALKDLPPERRLVVLWELALAHGKPDWARGPFR